MLTAFNREKGKLCQREFCLEEPAALKKMAWIDLLSPTQKERSAVSEAMELALPTVEKIREIESSSRLYEKDETYYMTVNILTSSKQKKPKLSTITFIIHRGILITLRYEDSRVFREFIGQMCEEKAEVPLKTVTANTIEALFFSLLEAIIDRVADRLEESAEEIDMIAERLFDKEEHGEDSPTMHRLMSDLARQDTLTSHIRESLSSLERMVAFIELHHVTPSPPKTIMRDLISLKEHCASLINKINFLLNGCLGVISIEQNRIIKIFSVAAVVFLPPTLVASIYGMNFHEMPELSLRWGYPSALILMLLSAMAPYIYFKRRGWI